MPGLVRAVAMRGARVVWAAEASYATETDLTDALARLATERPNGFRRARALLDGRLAQAKRVGRMPPVASADLASHVALLPRRYFLQDGQRLVTDAVPLAAANGNSHRPALLVAAAEPVVLAVYDGARAAGLRLLSLAPAEVVSEAEWQTAARASASLSEGAAAFVTACAAALGAEPPVLLAPAGVRRERARAVRARTIASLIAGAAALLLAAGSYWYALARQRAAAEAQLAALATRVAQAQALRRDLDDATDALEFLERQARSGIRRSPLLAEVARTLPNSTFLALLRVDADGRGTMVGYAPGAARAVVALEGARTLRAPRLDGPVTREVLGGREWERFTVRFTARRGEDR